MILLSSIPDRAWTGLKAPISWSTLLDWSFYLSPSIQLWKHDSKKPNWSTLLRYRFAKEQRRWTLTLWGHVYQLLQTEDLSCLNINFCCFQKQKCVLWRALSHYILALSWGQVLLLQAVSLDTSSVAPVKAFQTSWEFSLHLTMSSPFPSQMLQ